jgi:hypothetical protein
MKFIIIICFLLTALSVQAENYTPANTFRCEPHVISLGATQSEVLKKCGRPSYIQSWEQERIKRDFYREIPVPSPEELSQEPLILREFVKVEEWEYNQGPTRFTYYLRFENGRLKSIMVGGYGY